jgi:hypothetical protein
MVTADFIGIFTSVNEGVPTDGSCVLPLLAVPVKGHTGSITCFLERPLHRPLNLTTLQYFLLHAHAGVQKLPLKTC